MTRPIRQPLPFLVAACIGLMPLPAASAGNFARGQELFEDHCQACHEDFHKQDSRHVRSLAELGKRVEAWASHTDTEWKRGEVEDVLEYLNRSFYRF